MSNQSNRRKEHVAQLAKQMHKKTEHESEQSGLVEQYKVIREDILKLRDDLSHGYDMARNAVEKKSLLSELMKLRENF